MCQHNYKRTSICLCVCLCVSVSGPIRCSITQQQLKLEAGCYRLMTDITAVVCCSVPKQGTRHCACAKRECKHTVGQCDSNCAINMTMDFTKCQRSWSADLQVKGRTSMKSLLTPYCMFSVTHT